MDWFEAKKACEKLGKGWRLPTLNELLIMYKNRDKIGGFGSKGYWSSAEEKTMLAWYFSFAVADGLNGSDYKTKTNHVRAVRTF